MLRYFVLILCSFLLGVVATCVFKLFAHRQIDTAEDYVIEALKDLIKILGKYKKKT